ncbi:MAG: exodeoxyribonuclease VII large subunit [Vampirovibrionales bacterium]|nr:exodeoxyribonuclease VII large subunit [Vampirovibrionales bacterium]
MSEQQRLFETSLPSPAARDQAAQNPDGTKPPAPKRKRAPRADAAISNANSSSLAPSSPSPLTVSELTALIKGALARDPALGQTILVEGELSNVSVSSRGHAYFMLKDDGAAIKGVIWASVLRAMPFELKDGLAVTVSGALDVYAPNGTYSLVARRVEPIGVGALQLAFLQIKERLEREGLFLPDRKRDLPAFPLRAGVITSPTGAVWHDMMRVIRRKNPVVSVLLAPVPVQGAGASQAIADALDALNALRGPQALDVILLARGGGSYEDLFCFSEEPAVRAVNRSRIPVVCGIGHEPDFSLCDAAADYSASTPTAAAEWAIPDYYAMTDALASRRDALLRALGSQLMFFEQSLDQRATRLLSVFEGVCVRADNRLRDQREALIAAMEAVYANSERKLSAAAAALEALSPLRTLSRGYAMIARPDGSLIRSVAEVTPEDALTLRLSDGEILAHARAISPMSPHTP